MTQVSDAQTTEHCEWRREPLAGSHVVHPERTPIAWSALVGVATLVVVALVAASGRMATTATSCTSCAPGMSSRSATSTSRR